MAKTKKSIDSKYRTHNECLAWDPEFMDRLFIVNNSGTAEQDREHDGGSSKDPDLNVMGYRSPNEKCAQLKVE